jgi:hypothetical protein
MDMWKITEPKEETLTMGQFIRDMTARKDAELIMVSTQQHRDDIMAKVQQHRDDIMAKVYREFADVMLFGTAAEHNARVRQHNDKYSIAVSVVAVTKGIKLILQPVGTDNPLLQYECPWRELPLLKPIKNNLQDYLLLSDVRAMEDVYVEDNRA